ncbi:MAG: CocE/NonD family hydrolase [Bacillota bacterium]
MKISTEMVAMSDGIQLATDVYLPGDGSYPVVMAMTPYGRQQMRPLAQPVVSRGYALVVQDVRGRYDSEGEFNPIEQERQDGPETVAWLGQQPWFDAESGIGMLGLSYLGEVALLLAARCPEVKAIIDVGAMADFWDVSHRGGALVLHHSLPWTIITSRSPQPSLRHQDWAQVYATRPLVEAASAAGHDNQRWRSWVEHEVKDAYWERWSIRADLPAVKVPILHFSGWYDICLGSTLDLYNSLSASAGQPHRLILGPWTHNGVLISKPELLGVDFGSESSSRAPERILAWFDYWLKGEANGALSEPTVQAFLTGSNRWVSGSAWPLPNSSKRRFYLGDGSLMATPPGQDLRVSFVSDPAKPIPTIGGSVWEFQVAGLDPGPADQAVLSQRPDVVVFETETLDCNLDLVGPVRCTIFGELDTETADWVCRLVDVAPDGTRRWVADGIVRAHLHSGTAAIRPVSPGKVEEYQVDLWATGHTFRPGHRLALEVSGSSFPKWSLNLHSLDGADPVVARQTIHTGPEYPSYLEVFTLEE